MNSEERLRGLITQSGLSLKLVAEACGMPKSEILEWWSKRRAEGLETHEVRRFCEYFGISIQALIGSHTLPVEVVRRRAHLGANVLPVRYAEDAQSFVRGLLHIFEFLNLYCGRPRFESLLAEMQVHPSYFETADNEVSLRFVLDLFRRLPSLGLSDDAIAGLGRFVSLRNQDTALGALFAQATDFKPCYAVLSKHISKFDRSFAYRITVTRRELVIELRPTESTEKILAEYPSAEVARFFRYLRKALGWFPTLSGLSPLELKDRACVSRGHFTSLFQIDLRGAEPNVLGLTQILGGLSE